MPRNLNIYKRAEGLSYKDMAERMSEYLDAPISQDSVAKYFSSNTSGVPLEKIEAFLQALGLRVVPEDHITIPKERHDALILFAKRGIDADIEE